MSIKYIAFDIETPNRLNNRISSIALSIVDDSYTIRTIQHLVNPECDFDHINISLTGITPDIVADAPTFPIIWEQIKPLFRENIVVAHNASFDMCVLGKTLSAYGLSAPVLHYICTMKLSRQLISDVPNYKLPTLCAYFNIPLEHHRAGSDSKACANIMAIYMRALEERGISIERFAETYDCANSIDCRSVSHHHISENSNALKELNTVLTAISCDGFLSVEEINFLIDWMNNNSALKGNFPYDRIYNKLVDVLEDGIVTQQEHDELLQLFQTANNPVDSVSCSCDCLELTGKNICLSGEFNHGSKDQVSALLTQKGANIQSSVTKKTNIVVVGGQGNSNWVAGNYGTKIKKALEFQSKGLGIMIIREADFWDNIGE